MLKLNYFLTDIFILSAEKQPIKLSWRKIEWLLDMCNTISFAKDTAVLKEVRKLIKDIISDIIYCHRSKVGIGYMTAIGLNIPVIYNPHG